MLMASHNILYRKKYPIFLDSVEMVRINSPHYTHEELIEALQESMIRFLDINIQVRMKPQRQAHDFIKLLKLAGKHNVDWVGISNVEKVDTYEYVKKIIDNDKVKICAKIESDYGCWIADDIIMEFDGVMVDTEDLAFEVGWNKAIEEKNRIYKLCEEFNKPYFRLVGTIFELIN